MLVLSRKKDESVILSLPDGRTVKVMTVELREDKVRLGFDAPQDVGVDREEIFHSKQRSRRESADGEGTPR